MADKKISQLPASTVPLAGTEVLPIVQGGTTKQVSVANLTAGRVISATQFTSTVAIGTPPLVVTSTTEVANLRSATATLADSATSANALKSNATTGVLQVTGPAAASTRVMTTPDADFTAARTDAANSFTGNQTLSTGNLVIGTSGKGIDFSATPGTGTSELFADYEEGTWTATLTDGTNSVSLGTAIYTKIGRNVTLIIDAYNKSMSGLSTSANLTITGIPFVPVNGSVNAWMPAVNVASTSFAIYCATDGIIYPIRTNNAVDINLIPLSVFGSPANMSWQFVATYTV